MLKTRVPVGAEKTTWSLAAVVVAVSAPRDPGKAYRSTTESPSVIVNVY